jgi:hypothetical protein
VFVVSLSGVHRYNLRAEWTNLVMGAWTFLAPWILRFATGLPKAAWDHWIVGGAIVILAVWSGFSTSMTGPKAHA